MVVDNEVDRRADDELIGQYPVVFFEQTERTNLAERLPESRRFILGKV